MSTIIGEMPNALGHNIPITERQMKAYLCSIIMCMVQEGYLCQIKGTPLYRQQLAFHGNKLLEQVRKQMDDVVDKLAAEGDGEINLELMIGAADKIIPQLTQFDCEDLPYIAAMQAAFLNDKARMVNLLTAHFPQYIKLEK